MKIKNLIPLVCLLIIPTITKVAAQSGKLFTLESGLSSSMVTDIHQTRNGFVWVATEDGLNRFDGSKNTLYRADKNIPGSVLNDMIVTLGSDAKGVMYVGYLNGLQYYHDANDSFFNVPLWTDEGKLSEPHVTSILQRKNGQLLVGTSGYGIFEIHHGEDGQPYGLRLVNFEPSNFIVRLFENKAQELWIATENDGLFKFSNQQKQCYFSNKKGQKNVIMSICEDKYGTLLVGKLNGGLHRYDASTDIFDQVPSADISNSTVLDLYVGTDNRIYVGTEGYGMKIYHPETNALIDLNPALTTFNLSTTKTSSILEDHAGNLWVGISQKGVFLLHRHKNRFSYIGNHSSKQDFIGDNAVTSIYEDRSGWLWVGTDRDGLYQLDGSHAKSIRYKATSKCQPPASIMAIFEDTDGDFWLGGSKEGLINLNRRTGICRRIPGLTDKNGDQVELIHSICEDKRHRLWVGSMGAGLFCLEKKSGAIKNFCFVKSKDTHAGKGYLPNNWINCLLITPSDKLYIGTYDGLACLDLNHESFISTFGTDKLFAGSVVYSLLDDQKGNLWVGTSKGLMRLDMETGKTLHYQMEHGLPSNTVYAIEIDTQGNLWLSTNRGLAKMDIHENRFINFYSDDGLQGNEFTRGVSLLSESGELYFGGINGISHFNPLEIQVRPKSLSVNIVDFYVHDKPVKTGMKSGKYQIIDTVITSANVFNLAHNDNSFTIEFSTMDFNQSDRVQFEYQVNDNDWVTLRTGLNRVTFDHLETGNHRLRYRAKVNETYSRTRHAQIIINPVWFLSFPAKILYALFIILSAMWILKTLQNRQLYKKQMLAHRHAEEINEAKLQFFIHIAHEIRTPLTLVINPLKKLLGRTEMGDQDGLYRLIDRNIQRMLDLVNQLMDIRKIENGQMNLHVDRVEMVSFAKTVSSLFSEEFAIRGIKFCISHQPDTIYAQIDIRNFDKVLINLLSNACKFTPDDGEIRMAMIKKHSTVPNRPPVLRIEIADSGQLLSDDEFERIFNCFYQAENSKTYQGYSTGVGLHLTRQLVEMHNGSIRVENVRDWGYAFIIEIPLDSDQESAVHINEHAFGSRPQPLVLTSPFGKRRRIQRSTKRILVVDDDIDIREYLRKELSPTYLVNTFANGEDAYKSMLSAVPDLVISDVMMPIMDGMILCKKIRESPLVHHIPIVLLTAKSEDNHQLQGLGLGADLYIIKPFNMEVLAENIKTLLRNREIVRIDEREAQLQEAYISKVNLKSSDEKLLEKVHKLIEKHIGDPSLSVEMIASEIGISRVHLHRKLKELTHLTTKDLIKNIRLKQAADLLISKKLTVSEVAYAVGYNDVNSFSVAFKTLYGVVPKEFATQKNA
ncbi:ligand-binding sensor domain-containing protein [Olivibacter domesticus]|uniref:histidine kinase n=2 Tax=Olivibacter domesticus TaxID=407022 RepID=A0A1H7MH25_OLID1|nr:ligand-binding sensor domain-containing protein [Olivibacter domesticus]